MLTSRGWWFFFFVLLQGVVGILVEPRIGPVLMVISFALLAWFLFEWGLFAVRVRFAVPKLYVQRVIRVDKRTVPVVWAGQEFEVSVDVGVHSVLGLPYITFQDRPPSGCERVDGKDFRTTSLSSDEIAGVTYRLKCEYPGEVRFEGVRIQIADFQGFFYHRTFIRVPVHLLVLPPLTDAEGKRRTKKSHNILPPPGVHRLRQSGGGSELMDLREYRPGDPPKMIAWKASARREILITKEFESDVPIRCTLFIDRSQSTRIGVTGKTMLQQMTTLSSAIAQAAASDRDLVGLVLFDEHDIEVLLPARNPRHTIEMLHRLARAAEGPVVSPVADIDTMLQLATPLAHELYPDLMDRSVNRLPIRMFWEPILDYSKGRWLFFFCIPFLLTLLWVGAFAASFGLGHIDPDRFEDAGQLATWTVQLITWLGDWIWVLLGVICIPPALGFLWWLGHGLSGQFPPWYTTRFRRKRLASLMAALDDAPVGTEARLLDDDDFFADRMQRFLAYHHRRYPITLYDEDGNYLFRSVEKLDTLGKALIRSVGRARDNELFVLMVDLIELDGDLDPLLKGIRVAVARHHHVMVICPWMAGIPMFKEGLGNKAKAKAIREEAKRQRFQRTERILHRELVYRYHAAYERIRRIFAKLGVMLIRAEEGDSARLVLNRMDRLRGVRARR